MSGKARDPDLPTRVRHLEELVRRLGTRKIVGRFDPVTDGTPFLCDGWNAPFAVIGEPPEHTGSNFGFYRGSDRVYWRGRLSYEGVTSNGPDYTDPVNDAEFLFETGLDAAGASGGGVRIPQAFWPDHALLISVPADNENSFDFVYGRWAQLLIFPTGRVQFHGVSTGGTMIGPADTAATFNQVRDASNRVHLGVPAGTVLDFEAVSYRPRYSG